MKKIIITLLVSSLLGLLSSCELDNYDGPTAGLAGSLIDDETNEPVQQDIIRGSVVEIIEHGYTPVTPQYLIIKSDGTYENSRLFANTYTIEPKRGNFKPVTPQEVNINGNTRLDFRVIPYIRLKEVSITKNGNTVTATFKLQQTNVNNVKRIGLYVHLDPHVGEPMNIAKVEQDINAVVDPNTVYTLTLDTATDSDLKSGKQYFFRVGALTDVGEAKFNYASSIIIGI